MKPTINLSTILVCFFGVFTLVNNNIFSQGNNNGNANSNNNSNANALKWDRHGNQVDTTDFIGTTNASALKFKSDNVERLRITEDGRVGVGVTEPTKDFEVLGNTMLRGDLYLPVLDTVTPFNDEEILFLDKNDRVVKGNVNTLKSLMYSPYDGPISLCDPRVPVQQSPTWSNGTSKIFSLCPDVYIGVGTNSPQKLLDIRGTTQTRKLEVGREYSGSSLISGFRSNVSSNTVLTLGNYNPQTQTEHVALELKSAGELSLNHNSSYQGATDRVFTISNDNRKIVYVDANDETLYARKIVVDEEVWPDYVFKTDYELMPLNKVKAFIAQNGHLPNVPSAEEVEENGVDLGETAKITMEKVEELTLYLIEQQELLEKQQELLKQQQKEIEQLKAELKK